MTESNIMKGVSLMCKAKHYTEQLLNTYDEIKEECERLNKELRKADLYEQDLLHIIENGGFNAYEGYRLAKMISDNRQKRRQIKNELEPLQQLKNSFIDKNITELNNTYDAVIRRDKILTNLTENKVYTPRVLETTDLKVVSGNSEIKEMKHRKTGKEIISLNKVNKNLYYAIYKDKSGNLINKKDIVNLDQSKVVNR
jgi:hypothetical protein